jgi:predicted nucleic acid-binding protein
MKIFLDANVLVSVLNREYPLFPLSARVLSLSDRLDFELVTSPICLAIAFYFSEKKSGSNLAKKKIEVLSTKLKMTSVDQAVVDLAIKNSRVTDFEDGLEYYSAINSTCEIIVTEDQNGFFFSDIPVYTCKQFLQEIIF